MVGVFSGLKIACSASDPSSPPSISSSIIVLVSGAVYWSFGVFICKKSLGGTLETGGFGSGSSFEPLAAFLILAAAFLLAV